MKEKNIEGTLRGQEVIDAVGERKGQEFLNYCNRELENPLLRREVVCDVLEEALRAVRTEHEHLEMAGPRALSGEYRYPLQWRKAFDGQAGCVTGYIPWLAESFFKNLEHETRKRQIVKDFFGVCCFGYLTHWLTWQRVPEGGVRPSMDSRLVISENPKVATDEEAERYLIEEYRPGNFFTLERSNPDYQGWPIEGNIGGIAYRGQLLFLVHLFIVDPVVKQAYFSSFCSIEFHRFKGESIPINRDVIPLLDTHPRLADQFWQDLHDRVAIYRNRGEWPSDVHSDRENLGTHLHQQLLELWKASQRELRKIEFKATGYDPADTFSLTLGEDQAGRPHPAEHESEGAAKEKREAGGPQKSTKKKGRPRTAGGPARNCTETLQPASRLQTGYQRH